MLVVSAGGRGAIVHRESITAVRRGPDRRDGGAVGSPGHPRAGRRGRRSSANQRRRTKYLMSNDVRPEERSVASRRTR